MDLIKRVMAKRLLMIHAQLVFMNCLVTSNVDPFLYKLRSRSVSSIANKDVVATYK